MKYLIFLSLFLTSCTISQKEVAWQTLNAIDFIQTEQALNDGFEEANFLMGSNPSDTDLALWWAGTSLGHWVITEKVMKTNKDKNLWLDITIGGKAGVIGWNFIITH